MLLHLLLCVLWLTTNSLSTPLRSKYVHHAPRTTRRASSLPKLDRQAALAARAAARRKFQNANALLAGLGTSPGYAIPSSLQETYDRASDLATNITFLNSLSKSQAKLSYPSSGVRLAAAGSLGNVTTVPLQDETDGVDDYEYFGPLAFGSQAQALQIDFDTGSADLWVPVDCNNCGTLSLFQANASSTYQDTTQPFAVTYGSGSVMGTLAMDMVSVGPFKVYNQSIGAVQSVSDNFADSPNDGLAGMAFTSIASSHKPTLFENLIPQLRAPLFSVYTTRNQVHGSELYLGGIDLSKARGDIVFWVPVVSKTYWTVSMTTALVNNTPAYTGILNTIIDTGTSFIYVPTDVVTAIFKQIPGAAPARNYDNSFYAYPCDTPITVSFVLGPHKLALDPRDLNLGKYASDPSGRTCIAAIADAGRSVPFAILGDSFLKSYVTVFDYSHGARVGFVGSING